MLLHRTLFPQPDSPTTARTSPLCKEKETSLTACTSPFGLSKLTDRFRTSNTFSIFTIDTAFKYNNFGMASAMAVVMIFMIVAVRMVQKFITEWMRRKEEKYA